MSTASPAAEIAWSVDPDLWRCLTCGGTLAGSEASLACGTCGRRYPIRDGTLVVKDDLTDNNRVVSDYYNGPLWPKFRFWEYVTWAINGGERRARNKVLHHLPQGANLKLLDVAIGDGVYLDWLPQDWRVVGVDISSVQLAGCRRRAGSRDLPLVLGEAEDLPFHDHRFDAVLSIGGFNYFNDPERSLREMVRVVRPGGTIVVSDEVPNLTDQQNIGRKLGMPGFDRWMISLVTKNLGKDFNEIVERYHDLDVRAIAQRVLPTMEYELVWRGVGYVLFGRTPE